MLYFLLTLLILFVALMLLRVRVRVHLSPKRRLLFVGLGRSGPEFDFVRREGKIKLFGMNIKTIDLAEGKTAGAKKPAKEKRESKEKLQKKQKPEKAGRQRPVRDFLKVLPPVASAAFGYLISLLRSIIIEQLEGEIEAGFDTPDVTGTVFGYYQAALGAVPAIAGRFRYIPRWDQQYFGGSVRLSLAIPVYRIALRTIVFIYKLPLRDLIKLAIGKKKGDQDVQ
ncbi:MAG: hypothetical protein AB1483_05790 [Candidatus Zixiibacteriota bacterium]